MISLANLVPASPNLENYMDFVAPLVLLVIFLAVGPWSRKVYWLTDTYATATFGLGLLLVPKTVMSFQFIGTLDELHLTLFRQMGAGLLGLSLTWFLSRKSLDERMFGNHLLARSIGLTLMLACMMTSYSHMFSKMTGLRFSEKFLSFGCVGVGLWLLAALVQLTRTRQLGAYITRPNYVQFGLVVEHAILLTTACLLFAFPNSMAKMQIRPTMHLDAIHVTIIRMMAALQVSMSLQASYSTGFLYPKDKMAYLLGRVCMCVIVMPAVGFATYTGVYVQRQTAYFVVAMFIYLVFLVTLCRNMEPDTKAAARKTQ